MRRSLSYLRRGLLGIALAGSLGFGVSHAFAEPATQARRLYCTTVAEYQACRASCAAKGLYGTCDQQYGCICES